MEESHWLGSVGIVQVHIGDSKQHDGYVEVHLGASLNRDGERALEKRLVAKVKGLDSITVDRQTVKLIARPKRTDGDTVTKLDNGELRMLANSCIRSMKSWAASLEPEQIVAFTTAPDFKAAMAGHSSTSTFHGADRNE